MLFNQLFPARSTCASMGMRMGLVASLALLSSPVWGMVAGAPEPPRPGPMPTAWLSWTNDSFGGSIGRDMDDFRTNAFSGGFRYERWVVSADYSMMTDYRMANASKLRSDELSATLGYEVIPDETKLAGGQAWLATGAGTRISGALGGNAVQNRWHELMGYKPIDLTYAEQEAIEGVGYVTGHYLMTGADGRGRSLFGDLAAGRAGIELDGALLGTTNGSLDGSLGASLVIIGVDGAAAIGVQQEWHTGHRTTEPSRVAVENESGTWITWSTSTGGWFFRGGYNVTTGAGLGTLGWMWKRPPGRAGSGTEGVMEGIVGFYQGYAYGVQYRWRTAWLDQWSNRHATLIADYRFGQHPRLDWHDNSIVIRQPVVGIDWAFTQARDGFQVIPFLYTAVGAREEIVKVSGKNPRFPEQNSVSGVAQAGGGVRIYGGNLPTASSTARYGVSLVYDAWMPFTSATATNASGNDRSTYMVAGGGFGARLAAMAMW